MSRMIGSDVADYLASRGLGNVHATDNTDDIFQEQTPKGQPKSLTIVTQPGRQPDLYLDTMEDGLTIYASEKSAATAYERLVQVKNVLHRNGNYDLSDDLYVYFSYALAGITYVDTDLNGRKIYSLDVNFQYRDKNLIS
jgi:hypothetical protein